MRIEYKGGRFRGSQLQIGVRTVQDEIEKALSIFFRAGADRGIKATFCGRTDTGVHARGQVVHFDLPDQLLYKAFPDSELSIANKMLQVNSKGKLTLSGHLSEFQNDGRRGSYAPLEGEIQSNEVGQLELAQSIEDRCWANSKPELQDPDLLRPLEQSMLTSICWALNGILPEDVSITAAQVVPYKFNARYSARRRTYVYRILNRPQRSALLHKAQYLVRAPLDIEAMNLAAQSLLGQHDFIGFKTSNKEKASTICIVERAEIFNKGEAELEFWISANHFVYNMVRIIVGTLIEVGDSASVVRRPCLRFWRDETGILPDQPRRPGGSVSIQ
jgi:tRNA pseudouridine(38-40) synthase